MADYCSIGLVCRASDAHLFEALGYVRDGDETIITKGERLVFDTKTILPGLGGRSAIARMFDGEAVFRFDDKEEARPEIAACVRVPFLGSSSGGNEYGPFMFACDGKDIIVVETTHGQDFPVVRYHPSGRFDAADVGAAKRYFETRDAAMRRMLKEQQRPMPSV